MLEETQQSRPRSRRRSSSPSAFRPVACVSSQSPFIYNLHLLNSHSASSSRHTTAGFLSRGRGMPLEHTGTTPGRCHNSQVASSRHDRHDLALRTPSSTTPAQTRTHNSTNILLFSAVHSHIHWPFRCTFQPTYSLPRPLPF